MSHTQDLTSSPDLLEIPTDKLDNTEQATHELQFPTIRLDTSLESLMSCSQRSSSTTTIMPQGRPSSQALDESWTTINAGDFRPDEDALSERTDAASTLDMNSICDSESIIVETDDESATAEVERQDHEPSQEEKYHSSDSTDAQIDRSASPTIVRETLVAGNHTTALAENTQQEAKSCTSADTPVQTISIGSMLCVFSSVSSSTVVSVLCTLLITILVWFTKDFVTTYRPSIQPAVTDFSSTNLALSISNITQTTTATVMPSTIVNQEMVMAKFADNALGHSTADSLDTVKHHIRSHDTSSGKSATSCELSTQSTVEAEDNPWWFWDRNLLHQISSTKEAEKQSVISDDSRAAVETESWSPATSDNYEDRRNSRNTSQSSYVARIVRAWIAGEGPKSVPAPPSIADAKGTPLRSHRSEMKENLMTKQMQSDGANVKPWADDAEDHESSTATVLPAQLATFLEILNLRVQDLEVVVKHIHKQAQMLALHVRCNTNSIVAKAADMIDDVDMRAKAHKGRLNEVLTSLYTGSTKVYNEVTEQVECIRESHKEMLKKAQQQAHNMLGEREVVVHEHW